jgi:hypothetical protein
MQPVFRGSTSAKANPVFDYIPPTDDQAIVAFTRSGRNGV